MLSTKFFDHYTTRCAPVLVVGVHNHGALMRKPATVFTLCGNTPRFILKLLFFIKKSNFLVETKAGTRCALCDNWCRDIKEERTFLLNLR